MKYDVICYIMIYLFLIMQMLEFRVFNIAQETQPLRGCLSLSAGSSLSWFGFSEEGQLCSYDSKVLIVFIYFPLLMNISCHTN